MMRITATLSAVIIGVLFCATPAKSQQLKLGEKKVLTLAIAKKIAAAAEEKACDPRCQGVIAIVDDAGNLIYLERNDNTQPASLEIAIRKAQTAALYQRSTKVFDDRLKGGETFYTTFPNMLPVVGGEPLVVDGQVVGGIGESGYVIPGKGNMGGVITGAGVNALAKIVGH